MARAIEYVRVFRFGLKVSPSLNVETHDECAAASKFLGVANIEWDGPHLVITRGIVRDKPSLIHEIGEKGLDVRVVLFDEPVEGPDGKLQHVVFREWKLKYERVQDRGFSFLDAMRSEAAKESVCVVNAEMVEVRR